MDRVRPSESAVEMNSEPQSCLSDECVGPECVWCVCVCVLILRQVVLVQ